MYKVGIMLMGKPTKTPKKVKEIIIEVEAKTKIIDILKYLHDLKRIEDTNVNVAIEKNGRPVSESSTVTQILKHTKLVNNIIKLFLYEHDQDLEDMNSSAQKIVWDSSKQGNKSQMLSNSLMQSPGKQKKGKLSQNQSFIKSPDKSPSKSPGRQPEQSQAHEQIKNSGCCCC